MSSANAHSPAEGDFASFRLDSKLTRGLEAAGFSSPRPIQTDTIPAALEGRDVMGLAQTGTGKTAAFALPILQRLIEEPGDGPLALILAPTRELAIQIDAEIRVLAKFTDIQSVTIFGGVSANTQIKQLRRRPEIVVGCPGRVLDLLNRGVLDLAEVETLVLDEADHMFDMGFIPDIKRILKSLPSDRQNLLFSATMPKAIRALAHGILNKPHVVELEHTAPTSRVEHALCPIAEGSKKDLLERVLGNDECQSAIVFTRTKHRAKRMALQLAKGGLRAVALQGNMSQGQRDRAMEGFRKGKFDILVATDIAARGLDVAGIDYVINYDPPSTPETYTHRIGRTGRSEATGKAFTFITGEDRAWVRDTERVLGAPIPRLRLPGFDTGESGGGSGSSESRPSRSRSGGNRNAGGNGRSRGRSGSTSSSAPGKGAGKGNGSKSEEGRGGRRAGAGGGRGRGAGRKASAASESNGSGRSRSAAKPSGSRPTSGGEGGAPRRRSRNGSPASPTA